MIKAHFPHMVLNSHDITGEEYRMWNTWKVPKSTSVDQMIERITTVAKEAPDRKLQTLIINSHGGAGNINIGQIININDVEKFRVWNFNGALIVRIWLVVCQVARINDIGDGNYFCYRLAQETGAYVTASSSNQTPLPYLPLVNWLPVGYIDDWEGEVFTWNPDGKLV